MYVKKMSAHASNDELLIHCFQDALTGVALIWYMGLDRIDIKNFNDLCEAFVQRYNYNLYLAPDRDQLQAMTQNDNESFEAYAQRWRDFAEQVRPPLKEKELAKIFLKTLDQFYYENMVASAPSNFAEMMTVGMRLEEGVREGRLVRESNPTDSSEEKDQEMSMVNGGPQQQYPVYHPTAAVMPDTNAVQNPGYQPQFPQYQQQPRQTPRTKFDPIPVKYAELLPDLLERNLVQTRPPPLVPKKFPARFRADLSCDFHQEALGHDVEHCYTLKNAVQDLVEDNILTFPDLNPNV